MRTNIKSLLFSLLVISMPMASAAGGFENAGQVQVRPEPAPPHLLAELMSRDATARQRAANQLGEIRARDAMRQLAQALLDRDPGVREAAAFALGQITDPQAINPLLNALADKDAEVKASAAFALGMIEDRRALRALSNALGERSVEIRSGSLVALGLMQDQGAVDEIIGMLDDPSIDVRYDAVWALGQIGAAAATDHLHAALVNLDLLKIDDNMLEAYRQAVQHSIERSQEIDEISGRPRRATQSRKQQEATELARKRAGVTQPLKIIQSVQPAPTERAVRARISGLVGLRVLVGVEGRAVRAYVARRLGYGLDQRAVQAVLQYRFDPEISNGLPQSVWTNIDVKF